MPDKNFKRGCGGKCIKCWKNKLNHANPEVKKYLKKHNIDSIYHISNNDDDSVENNLTITFIPSDTIECIKRQINEQHGLNHKY